MKRLLLTGVLLFALVLAGCAASDDGNKEITLAYVAWDSEIASHYVLKHVFEQNLGYEVEMLEVGAGPMWAGVAGGSADASVAAWLPGTHEHFYEEYKEELEDLGVNLSGTKIGLVVPSYMQINNIMQLQDNDELGAEMDYTITGIDPSAGIMTATLEAIEAYGLDNWTLLESSDAGMAAELKRAYDNNEPVIVTGWTPHWKFASYDLKYLEDPLGIYGGDENIHTIVRKGLAEDDPVAYKFLEQFNWTADDMASVMIEIQEGADPADAAAAWVEANKDKVDAWLK